MVIFNARRIHGKGSSILVLDLLQCRASSTLVGKEKRGRGGLSVRTSRLLSEIYQGRGGGLLKKKGREKGRSGTLFRTV